MAAKHGCPVRRWKAMVPRSYSLLQGGREARMMLCTCFIALFFTTLGYMPLYGEPQLTGVEINQALGVQKDNARYFVAGKNTAIRAFLSEPVTIDESRTWVKVSRNSQPAFQLGPVKSTQPVSSVDFLCTNMQACSNWPVGNYSFEVSVNGMKQTEPSSGSYQFQNGTSFRILAVPIKANYNGSVKNIADDRWKTMWKFTRTVYPVADDAISWVINPKEIDASDASYNLMGGDAGQLKVWQILKGLMPTQCKAKPQDPGCYNLIVGFIPEGIPEPGGITQGFMWPGAPVNVVAAADNDAPATVAHEMAHVYGIGDTYAGGSIRCSVNPAPDGYTGTDWFTEKPITNCNAGRLASSLYGPSGTLVSATQIPASQHAYEIGGRGILQEMADFMGSGANQPQFWITPDTYDWLFKRLVLGQADPRPLKLLGAGAPERLLTFSGFLTSADVVTLEPWSTYMDTTVVADTTGPLMVRALNATGDTLASTAFTVQFTANRPPGQPPRTVNEAFFSGVIRFPDGTVRFDIEKSGNLLMQVPVSADPPTVSNVTPAAGAILNGPYTITWDSNDPDGDTLVYTVEYNADVTNPTSSWMVLADNLTVTSWDEDFSLLPGGSHAKIRVTAYDGVFSASAESAEFTVLLKAPWVFIDDLPWGTSYTPGSDILLVAEAFDAQDEWLTDDKLRWTSSLSGILGYGSELIVKNLAAGTHRITLTATNSVGLTGSDSVTVGVGPLGSGSQSGGSSTQCFIATAAFGSHLHRYVKILRLFRDKMLLTSSMGTAFVQWYYRISPPLAEIVAKNKPLKIVVRGMLVPVIGFSALSLYIGSGMSIFLVLLLTGIVGMGIRRWLRRLRCPGQKNV